MMRDPDYKQHGGDQQEIKIPLHVLFDVLETLRISTMYLAPPEDWKPHKFDPPEEYAKSINATYRTLMAVMAEKMGVEL